MYAVSRDGEAIEDAHVRHRVLTGIAYGVQVAGLVPWYEEDDAQLAAGLSDQDWRALGAAGRAFKIAHYRLRRYVALHTSDAQAQAQERAQERAQKRR